jgi:hypothetical protein
MNSRRIFDKEPKDWQELELLVEQAFLEMGYEASRGRELNTIRGNVVVDVYAVKTTTPIPAVVVCECKHWAKPVEQSVVYAFRSVCADIGAHFGIVISKAGFQSGAEVTRASTNIHLLSFLEFQETFFDEWRTGIFMSFARMCDESMPLVYDRYTDRNPELQSKLIGVNSFRKYEVFFGETSYRSFFIERGEFPVTVVDPRGDPRELRRITLGSYREFFEVSTQGWKDAKSCFGI